MMKKMLRNLLLAGCFSAATLSAAESIGVVNPAMCASDSKSGKAGQDTLEDLKKQLGGHLESLEKDLNDLAGKINDAEYMDGLSPEAEMELRDKARVLNDEMMRYQNQYYQIFNQANMKIMQQLAAEISAASEVVAKSAKKNVILNKETCFYHDSSLDITQQVIAEMDKKFEENLKNSAK